PFDTGHGDIPEVDAEARNVESRDEPGTSGDICDLSFEELPTGVLRFQGKEDVVDPRVSPFEVGHVTAVHGDCSAAALEVRQITGLAVKDHRLALVLTRAHDPREGKGLRG